MSARVFSLADRIFGEIDKTIKVLSGSARAARPLPARAGGELVLQEADRVRSVRLMRVNHAGEVAAQALYRGQALMARGGDVQEAMYRAAAEEVDHLAWCEQRLKELKARPSLLNPLWFAGSFAIGAAAGARGDRDSLGFITETERQVEAHLTGHLDRLPAADLRSRDIVERMRQDEASHGATAAAMGGSELPRWLKAAMRLTARVMTRGSYWL